MPPQTELHAIQTAVAEAWQAISINPEIGYGENDSGPALLTISGQSYHLGAGVTRGVAIVHQWGAQLI